MNVPDRDSRGKNIEDPEDDQSESFVDDQLQRMKVSKNESKSSSSGPSRKSVTFKKHDMLGMNSSFQVSGSNSVDVSDLSSLTATAPRQVRRKANMVDMKARDAAMKARDAAGPQGVQEDNNDLISQDDSSNHRMMDIHSETQEHTTMDDVSRSGLTGFLSILRSAGSFSPSATSGSGAEKNDSQLDKKKGDD